jgi:hypothetical protein
MKKNIEYKIDSYVKIYRENKGEWAKLSRDTSSPIL